MERAQHFPPWVREALIRAAQTPGRIERINAIDRIVEATRRQYPELFRKEAWIEDARRQ